MENAHRHHSYPAADQSMASRMPNRQERKKEQSETTAKRYERQGISVGDIVILINDSTTRAFWKLSKSEQLLPGKNGKARAAVKKLESNSVRVTELILKSRAAFGTH